MLPLATSGSIIIAAAVIGAVGLLLFALRGEDRAQAERERAAERQAAEREARGQPKPGEPPLSGP